MKKFIFIFFSSLCTSLNSFAQVNLQTGSASYSIPIFDWQDDRSRLNLNVSLAYNSGNGLKVDEVASNVGQGWNLLAGGVITRIQIGEPDDQLAYDGNYDNMNKYSSGYLFNGAAYTNHSRTEGVPSKVSNFPLFDHENQKYEPNNTISGDTKLDQFYFSIAGKRTGSFVLRPNSIQYNNKATIIGESNLKIWYEKDFNLTSKGIRTTISVFYIKDEDGIIYKFSKLGLTHIMKQAPCNNDFQGISTQEKRFAKYYPFDPTSQTQAELINPYVVDSWYLTEILEPLTQRKVNFNYTDRQINNSTGYEFQITRSVAEGRENDYIGTSSAPGTSNWRHIIVQKNAIQIAPALTSIILPDYKICSLTYDLSKPRIDLSGDYPLAKIEIKENNRLLGKKIFNFGYFYKNSIETYPNSIGDSKKFARLCLRSIESFGLDAKEEIMAPIKFDYYLGSQQDEFDIVPPPYCILKDIWGYYNGNNINLINDYTYGNNINLNSDLGQLTIFQVFSLCYLKTNPLFSFAENEFATIKENYAKNGLLKKIILTANSGINYEYEQRKYWNGNHNELFGGVSVSKVTYNSSNGQADKIIRYNYLNEDGSSSLEGYETPVNNKNNYSTYKPEDKDYEWTWSCFPFGCCYYKKPHLGVSYITSKESPVDEINLLKTFSTALQIYHLGESVYKAADAKIASIFTDKKVSFGKAFWNELKNDIVVYSAIKAIQTILTCTSHNEVSNFNQVWLSKNLNLANPLPTLYKRVELKEYNSSETINNGSVVYQFTNFSDYPVWEISNPRFSNKQRYAPWCYGLLKKQTTFDKNGTAITHVENTYDFAKAKKTIPKYDADDLISCNATVKRTRSMTDIEYFSNNFQYISSTNDDLDIEFYDQYSGIVFCNKTSTTVYDPQNTNNTKTESILFDYNQNNFLPRRIVKTESNGNESIVENYYTIDFNLPNFPTIQAMINNNMLNTQIAGYLAFKEKGSTIKKYIAADISEFGFVLNGDIKVIKRFASENTQPINESQINILDPYSYPGLKLDQSLAYDLNGKILVRKAKGERNFSYLYFYDGRFIAATIENSDLYLDKPAYTSFETAELGNWRVNGQVGYSNQDYVTGNRSFLFNNASTLEADITNNSEKSYRLSFWATSNVSVSYDQSGGIFLAASPSLVGQKTVNGFTYYEYEIAKSSNTIRVIIGGADNTKIDELRLYPSNARMKTITYDPLIGKTSECDENNSIIYYEYDSFGRILFIKDEEKNIIKAYEYNTKR